MAADKNYLSFGSYLKTSRIQKGISLKDVSREIRISEETLLLIEKEDHDRLPAEVFVKGFLRAYADVVGADGEVAVRRYLSDRQTILETAALDSDLIKSSARVWPRFAISIGALLCIIALSVFGESLYRERYGGPGSSGYGSGNRKPSDVSLSHTRKGAAVEDKGNQKNADPGNNR